MPQWKVNLPNVQVRCDRRDWERSKLKLEITPPEHWRLRRACETHSTFVLVKNRMIPTMMLLKMIQQPMMPIVLVLVKNRMKIPM